MASLAAARSARPLTRRPGETAIPTPPPGSRRRSTPVRPDNSCSSPPARSRSTGGSSSSSTRASPCVVQAPTGPPSRRPTGPSPARRPRGPIPRRRSSSGLPATATIRRAPPISPPTERRARTRSPSRARAAFPPASSCSSTSSPARRGRPTRPGGVRFWASPDFRVVWQRHNPSQGTDDPFPDAFSWFSRTDRPTNEIKQIATVSGNTVSFTTPIHISYRASHTAQLTRFGETFTQEAGVEDLKVIGGITEASASSGRRTPGRRTSTTPSGTTRGLRWSARSE